jgi:exopolysaccharide biosynthesis polyprenyl glycosylphosphotransferase
LGADLFPKPPTSRPVDIDDWTEPPAEQVDATPTPSASVVEETHDVVVDLTQPSRPVIVDLVTTVEPREDLSTGLLVASRWQLAIKRALDIVGSLALLLLLSPILLVTAIAIATTSDGEVIHRQRRIGRDGRSFTMLKFRSMVVGAHEQRHLYEHRNSHDSGPVFKIPDDPRVTRVGRVIRRFSIDELPQLVNVLLGEMSLVGPRPERPHFVQQFARAIPRYADRHQEKAGMTGWAQVNGLRGQTSIEERTRFDLFYVEHWSLLFDLKILLKTLAAVFRDRNAY